LNSQTGNPVVPFYVKVAQSVKILVAPSVIYWLFYNTDLKAAALFGLIIGISITGHFGTVPNGRIFSGITDRFAVFPVLIYLVFREIQIYPKFPILMVCGSLFITVRAVIIIIHDANILRRGKDPTTAIGTRSTNKIFIALAVLFYTLKLYPFNNLAMIAVLMVSIADSFGLLWKYYKRRRGIKDLNLATKITLFRLLMSPAFLIVYFYDRNPNFADNSLILQIIAILFAIVFVVTDGLDGYFARKRNEVTKFGKYLDPFSDKICTLTIFLCFVASNYVPVWMVALIYYREASISVIRTLAAAENIVIAARKSGKWKTALQGTAISTILVLATVISELSRTSFKSLYPEIYSTLLLIWSYVPFSLMALVTVVTVGSGIDYILSSKQIMEKYFK
jgi:CDP-diacylglycerol--glycerol-3-phosphate 3-phosphatidyltransferase